MTYIIRRCECGYSVNTSSSRAFSWTQSVRAEHEKQKLKKRMADLQEDYKQRKTKLDKARVTSDPCSYMSTTDAIIKI